ncbi:MAG: ATP phosphoribosyltransferase regulatory subunit [Bryobacterales bacterium]
MKKVEPRLSRGLRDILPQEMLARQQMIDVIRRVYESYGFSPLDTPAVEFLDVLSGSAGQERSSPSSASPIRRRRISACVST